MSSAAAGAAGDADGFVEVAPSKKSQKRKQKAVAAAAAVEEKAVEASGLQLVNAILAFTAVVAVGGLVAIGGGFSLALGLVANTSSIFVEHGVFDEYDEEVYTKAYIEGRKIYEGLKVEFPDRNLHLVSSTQNPQQRHFKCGRNFAFEEVQRLSSNGRHHYCIYTNDCKDCESNLFFVIVCDCNIDDCQFAHPHRCGFKSEVNSFFCSNCKDERHVKPQTGSRCPCMHPNSVITKLNRMTILLSLVDDGLERGIVGFHELNNAFDRTVALDVAPASVKAPAKAPAVTLVASPVKTLMAPPVVAPVKVATGVSLAEIKTAVTMLTVVCDAVPVPQVVTNCVQKVAALLGIHMSTTFGFPSLVALAPSADDKGSAEDATPRLWSERMGV